MDAIYFLGHCTSGLFTWEFGFIGVQRKTTVFARFESSLKVGKHIFFVDIEPENETILSQVMLNHPKLIAAGNGPSVPQWFILMQDKFKLFCKIHANKLLSRYTDSRLSATVCASSINKIHSCEKPITQYLIGINST